jgi:hypothetical protein
MNYRDFFKEDMLPGGKGDIPPSNIDPAELAMGIKVEMEHTKDDAMAKKIAQDHLAEDSHYYTKLKQSGLADELEPTDNKGIVEPNTDSVNKQTTPGTVFPEVPNDPSKGPDMAGCIGSTKGMETKDKTEVEAPAKDPEPTDHITGAIGSTPSNPNILPKQSGQCGGGAPVMQTMMKALMPKDISIDIAEGKKILEKMKEDIKHSPSVKGAATAFGPKQEGVVPVAGDPDKDPHFVKGKRWTVKWGDNQIK